MSKLQVSSLRRAVSISPSFHPPLTVVAAAILASALANAFANLTAMPQSQVSPAKPSRTVLITGSSRGIGLALVAHYQKQGWRVLATVRDPDSANKLHALAPDRIVTLDVGDEASIQKAAADLQGEAVDVLINNAGIAAAGSLDDSTKCSLMKQFEVNSVGPFLIVREFQPHLKAAVARHGVAKVVGMSSILGSITESSAIGTYRTFGYVYGYRASKAAVNILNASLALELKDVGIATLVIHPGTVATDMLDNRGSIEAPESASGIATVIADATMETTGKFFDFEGNAMPW